MEIKDQSGNISIAFTPKGMTAPLIFTDVDQLATWGQKQKQFFAKLPNTLLDNPVPISNEIGGRFTTLANAAVGLKNQHPQQRHNNKHILSQLLTLVENGALPTTESPRGIEIASLYQTNHLAGAALLALTFDENSGSLQPIWPAVTSAKAVLEAFSGVNYTAAANAQEAVFNELRRALSEKAKSLLDEIDTGIEQSGEHYEERKKQFDELTKDFANFRLKVESEENARVGAFDKEKEIRDQEWKALKAAYSTHMQLSASVTYWNAKRRIHKIEADRAAKWFGWGAFVSAVIVIIAAYFLLGDVANANAIMQVRATIFVGFPAFLAVWALRFVSRRLVVNESLADDATERVAMVHAFKALEKEGKADPSERLLVLQALFRPATSPTDDTAPIAVVAGLLKRGGE